ncbi:uncharacterized protein LOC122066743 isoform X1 [Macadamia integrifolia]|uniref:uncharacterized protein LOC122066743 isoform X1 n=1 Tax=Macadamia integrifolia TaxID=60698 RepID=UPI001C4FF5CA|nr:uncharacterized protein LOC122066743 isoform X1 [Macadamia integrifolia]XP_042486524.1 uncharacterized protein LOC122066743 isoform X1 [Macadamia integrifolia]XP_042486530.1 uncharacterized protein LOC122066743 isoform X1 [Macadamia integrifolia]
MLRRQGLRLLGLGLTGLDWGVMASLYNKDPFFAGFHAFSQVSVPKERYRFSVKPSFDVSGSFQINVIDALRLKGCSDRSDCLHGRVDNEFHKPCALPPYTQPVRDSEVGLERGTAAWLPNGCGTYQRGSPLGFPDHPMPKKFIVAVDVDEVLGSFISALNKFIADRYSLSCSVSEYHVYEFFKIWNCSRDEADIRVHEFFKTSYFKTGIHPIPGSQRILQKLSSFCDLSVVTSRQNVIKDHTIEWIEKYYPGLFREIHFGNHFALDGISRKKSDICRSLGAQVLIDDNPRYAVECAEVGIRVLLFDYQNSYPWCKTGSDNLHPLVTKVHDWEEVEQQLVSWIIS